MSLLDLLKKPIANVVPQTSASTGGTPLSNAVSAIASKVPVATTPVPQSLKSFVSKPIATVIPKASISQPVPVTPGPVSDRESLTQMEQSLQEGKQQLDRDAAKVDRNNQKSIDTYNKNVADFNARANAYQKSIDSYNESIDKELAAKNPVIVASKGSGSTLSVNDNKGLKANPLEPTTAYGKYAAGAQKFATIVAQTEIDSAKDLVKRIGPTSGFTPTTSPTFKVSDKSNPQSSIDSISNAVSAAMGVINVAFSPITGSMKAAEGIPGIGTVAKVANRILQGAGEVASVDADALVDHLPISDENKAKIKPVAEELLGLLAQVALGKVAHEVAAPKVAELTSSLKDIAKGTFESATKDKITNTIPTQTIHIKADTIREYIAGRNLSEPEAIDLYKTLGRTPDEIRKDVKNGVSVDIPEKVVETLRDKPYWSRIKDLLNYEYYKSIPNTEGGFIKNPLGSDISESLKPLAEEAKKYKSIEDFSKTFEPETFYHGTTPENAAAIRENGFNTKEVALTTGISEAKEYGPEVIEVSLKKNRQDPEYFNTHPESREPLYRAEDAVPASKTQLTDLYNKAVGTEDLKYEYEPTEQLAAKARNIRMSDGTGPDGKVFNKPVEGESKQSKLDVAKDTLAKTEKKLRVKSVADEVVKAQTELEMAKTALEEHPAKPLVKYANKQKGELPEVIGGNTGTFAKRGDNISTESGFKDSETARRSYENYKKQKRRVDQLDQQLRDLKRIEKDKKVQQADIDAAEKFLAKTGKKTQKEIEDFARKSIKDKLSRFEARIQERRDEAHTNLRKLEQNLKDSVGTLDMETLSMQALADQGSNVEYADSDSLPKLVVDVSTSLKQKVGLLDYLRTPDRVLNKIGLGKNAAEIRKAYENYLAELPQHIDLLQEWYDRALKYEGSDYKIFNFLDGKMKIKDLTPDEQLVAIEIQDYLKDWAYRLGLPEDEQVSHYITHIFEKQLIEKEFDEDMAKIIREKIPGSVYDPFLEKRLGAKGYVQSTKRALEAYMKRAVRKANMDPALESLKNAATLSNGEPRIELSQYNYVKNYADRVNLRPTDLDTLLDNTIKQVFGYKFGQRPTAAISRTARRMVNRATLGLNFGSAIRNLTQGVNTYAKLGEKYTVIGYTKLLTNLGNNELEENGVLGQDMVQDKNMTAGKKLLQKTDKGLFMAFELAEKINRGAAYWGAKSKAIADGKTEEQAIQYAKKIVRDTQFNFGQIDTPVALQSDIAKTVTQLGNFTIKQTEFLTEMMAKKDWAGLIRYIVGTFAIVATIGKIFNIKYSDFVPNPFSQLSKFGTPPTLALPAAVLSAATNQPDRYGHPRDLKQKGTDVLSTAVSTLVPAGNQAMKIYRGFDAINKGKSEDSTQNKIRTTILGRSSAATPSKVQDFMKKYSKDTKSSAADFLKKYQTK